MFSVGQVSWFVKNFNIGIYSDTINVINVKTLHDGTTITHCVLSIHTTFSGLDYISRSHQQFSLRILCSYPVKLKLCTIVLKVSQVNKNAAIFHSCVNSEEVTDMLSDFTKTLMLIFWGWTV